MCSVTVSSGPKRKQYQIGLKIDAYMQYYKLIWLNLLSLKTNVDILMRKYKRQNKAMLGGKWGKWIPFAKLFETFFTIFAKTRKRKFSQPPYFSSSLFVSLFLTIFQQLSYFSCYSVLLNLLYLNWVYCAKVLSLIENIDTIFSPRRILTSLQSLFDSLFLTIVREDFFL